MTADEFEAAFQGRILPDSVELATGVTITDVPYFVTASIEVLRHQTTKRIVEPVSARLQKVLDIVNTQEAGSAD